MIRVRSVGACVVLALGASRVMGCSEDSSRTGVEEPAETGVTPAAGAASGSAGRPGAGGARGSGGSGVGGGASGGAPGSGGQRTTGGATGLDASNGSGGTGNGASGAGGESNLDGSVGDGAPADANDGASTTRVDSSCGALVVVPEQVVEFYEASFTDTITTFTPVAMFIMLDRSSSMVTGSPPPASSMSWDDSAAAIHAFVDDPGSAGVDIGLGTFPYGPNNTADCAGGTDCGTPVVSIASLPGNANAMIAAMSAQRPGSNAPNTPTECALRGMITTCMAYQAASPTGEKCVAVLVTDGTPSACDKDQQHLVMIIADGKSKGVDTYALGLPGADISALNTYAQAGGTGAAYDVSAGAVAFVTALNSIRSKITHQELHRVVTTRVVSRPVECRWKIPPLPLGEPPLNPMDMNLLVTPPNGVGTQFGHVASSARCPSNQNAWYFDDEAHPSEIYLCPHACTNVENVTGERIELLLHCPRIEATPS